MPRLPQPAVAPGASASVMFGVAGTVATGTYGFTVTGQAQVDGLLQTRTAAVSLEVLPAGTRAVSGSVLTAEAVPVGIPGVTVTLGSAFTLTDAAGNFTLLGPPAGPTQHALD